MSGVALSTKNRVGSRSRFHTTMLGPFDPLMLQVMLRVGDLPRSTAWYRDALGMQLVRERDNSEFK